MKRARMELPSYLRDSVVAKPDVWDRVIKTGARVASGFATSEPSAFYDGLWEYIQANDITDLQIRQALFMAPHTLCIGKALQSRGILAGAAGRLPGLLGQVAAKVNGVTRKLDGLSKLVEHYREMEARRIRITSAFIGTTLNAIVPKNPITQTAYADFVGRNTTRLGLTDMQSIHFPDALDSMAYDVDGNAHVDTFVIVMTPPDAAGYLSHGPANGANGDVVERVLSGDGINLVLYLNAGYPFTMGYGDAVHTVHVERFRKIAEAGRLMVVFDDSPVPGVPPGGMGKASPAEEAIAMHVVDHIETNKAFTYGRAIQVGIGRTGVYAIRALKDSGWHGRIYTEMLEPFTLDLFEAGKIAGSHFIERDGRRTPLDGKIVCTFTMGERGSAFYDRLDDNPAVVLAPSSRVVIPEGFYGGLGINNCLGIDFHGQVNAAGRGPNHHSGIGGLAQIVRGLGKGGVGYLCLKSTHTDLDGERCSSIMPTLPAGTPVALIGPDLMGGRDGARLHVVTEHGVARVSGRPQSQLIRELIGIAHPDFREQLAAAAYELFRVRV